MKNAKKQNNNIWPILMPFFLSLVMCVLYLLKITYWTSFGITSTGTLQSINKIQEDRDYADGRISVTAYQFRFQYLDNNGISRKGIYKSNNPHKYLALGKAYSILYSPFNFENIELASIHISIIQILIFIGIGTSLSFLLLFMISWKPILNYYRHRLMTNIIRKNKKANRPYETNNEFIKR